jgi:hypothetical protein
MQSGSSGDVDEPARVFGGDIDLYGFDAAVGLDDAFRHGFAEHAVEQTARLLAQILCFRRRCDQRPNRRMRVTSRKRRAARNEDGHKQRADDVANIHCRCPSKTTNRDTRSTEDDPWVAFKSFY